MTTTSGTPHEAGRLLRACLAERGWNVERLAAELGWETEAVEALLAGRTSPELAILEPVLETLDVPPLEFFRRLYGEKAVEAKVGADADEPLTRDEVEALVAEMRTRLQGARRSLEARKSGH